MMIDRRPTAAALLREGLRGMAPDERMRWKVRVEAFLATQPETAAPLHEDLCILSRIFNEREIPISHGTSFRINEWLKAQIAAASPSPPDTAVPAMSGHTDERVINPQVLRDHADRIEADDVPAVRAAALLREAAQAMHGFYDTREKRRIELERLYAVENSHAELVKALEKILQLSKPGQTVSLTQAIDILTDIWNESGAALAKATPSRNQVERSA